MALSRDSINKSRTRQMLLLELLNEPLKVISLLLVLVVGLTVHEFAHAWSAFRLGDPTAYMQGRMTLDPRKHIDPLGALVFLIAGFGWAKPVPIDPERLGPTGTLWVALAGPASNIAMAMAALIPVRLELVPFLLVPLFGVFAFFNIVLALFNMLPVAPLDGWKVLLGLVPREMSWKLRRYETYGPVVLLILLFADRIPGVPDVLGTYLFRGTEYIYRLLAGYYFG